MFDKSYLERLKTWRTFRTSLEDSLTPYEDTIEFWNNAPLSSIEADPYDSSTWPTPWQMIDENRYCDFTKILAIYYTLELTDRFSTSHFEIHITLDEKKSAIKYLLFVDNMTIGYYYNKSIDKLELPILQCQMQHTVLPTYY
jgi:hypothetical protein